MFNALSCDTTVEKDCESDCLRVPCAKPNTTATNNATNANTAPYSVMPCPDSSLRNAIIADFIVKIPRV